MVHDGEATGEGRVATTTEGSRKKEAWKATQADSVDIGRTTPRNRTTHEEEQRRRHRIATTHEAETNHSAAPAIARHRAAALRIGLQPVTEVVTENGLRAPMTTSGGQDETTAQAELQFEACPEEPLLDPGKEAYGHCPGYGGHEEGATVNEGLRCLRRGHH